MEIVASALPISPIAPPQQADAPGGAFGGASGVGAGTGPKAAEAGAAPSRPALGPEGREALARSNADTGGLSPEELAVVEKLKARDKEVRDHEQAHARVGGQYAGSPSYTYQAGPDGRNYAVGGEVPIDVAPVSGDPEATIRKMEIVKAAALAPAEPSSADRRIASLADSQRMEALMELNQQQMERPEQAEEGYEAARSMGAAEGGAALDLAA